MEDDPSILAIDTMMLENQGYTVLTASSLGEGIRIAESYPGHIDLLMTDVVMPEMNGCDLAQELLSYHPHLRHLFMSGYSANAIANDGLLSETVNFIQKPFGKVALYAKVREALDGNSAAGTGCGSGEPRTGPPSR